MGKPRGRNGREHMSQCGQRASFNRDRDAGGRTALVFISVWLSQRVRLADRIDVVEVDDIFGYDKLVVAEKTLGAKFNIRAFHDAVLELGSVPLPVVTARIDRFIAEDGKGPYPDME